MALADTDHHIAREGLPEKLRAALGLPEGHTPFPWQSLLLQRLVDGRLPSALDIPTGLGKTAVMAVWLLARAAGAKIPRRLVYVVDRRAVVDQATTVAERLREFVEEDEAVKHALGLERPLPISTLRGQFTDNREWLEDPSVPAIVLGTVDMVGSRLLFSGYGVSRKMRPYQAGLLGADALIVLDEAHLVPPFERLIEQIARGIDADGRSLRPTGSFENVVPPSQFLSLSATGRDRPGEDVVRLSNADHKHALVKKRLSARKRLTLRAEVTDKDLPGALASEAWALSKDGTSPVRIIVFCTSRDQAQKVQEDLRKRAPTPESIDTELFVGERRVFERDMAARWLRDRGFIAGSEGKPERATFVIATSAGEVGVDLDADHAVCDLVAWERMVQRFGRVNRRGHGDADVIVVPTSRDDKSNSAVTQFSRWRAWVRAAEAGAVAGADSTDDERKDDESEDEDDSDKKTSRKGPELKIEQRRLAEHALRLEAVRELIGDLRRAHDAYDVSLDGILDLRVRAMDDPRLAERIERATTPAPLHPPLTRALIEAWSMTSLEDHAGRPEVAPWIRGWPEEDEKPRTTVVWRTYLPITDQGRLLGKRDLETFRDAAAPHLAEQLESETSRVVEWLAKRVKLLEAPKPEDAEVDRFARPLRNTDVVAVIFDASEGRSRIVSANDLSNRDKHDAIKRALQGATIMVDRRVGGLKSGLLADDGDEEVLDVTEANLTEATTESQVSRRIVPFQVRRIDDETTGAPEGWRTEARIPIRTSDDGELEWLSIESLVEQLAESEEGRSGAKRNQRLVEHLEWAENAAKRIGQRLGLSDEHTKCLAVAARLHDEGKRAPCWQQAFRAPNDGKGPYAKTKTAPNLQILGGYRHELGSIPYAEADADVKSLPPELRELCLHIIAAHHGKARPLIPTTGAPEPPTRLIERARRIALRFTELDKQWGPWGLAWWEALLRAADQQASRLNDEQGGPRG